MKRFLISAFMLFAAGGSFASRSQFFMDGQSVELRSCSLPVMFTDRKEFSESILYWSALESRVASGILISDAKAVKARAVYDFQIRFNDASQVQWYSDHNGYTSYFKKDGYNDRAFYNKNGRWMFSVIYKHENQLPKDIRAAIKSVYYDWNMTMVEEVQSMEGKGYIIYLEDKSTIRILKVNADSEMETMMDLVKQ
jgi:hypothetical protein